MPFQYLSVKKEIFPVRGLQGCSALHAASILLLYDGSTMVSLPQVGILPFACCLFSGCIAEERWVRLQQQVCISSQRRYKQEASTPRRNSVGLHAVCCVVCVMLLIVSGGCLRNLRHIYMFTAKYKNAIVVKWFRCIVFVESG